MSGREPPAFDPLSGSLFSSRISKATFELEQAIAAMEGAQARVDRCFATWSGLRVGGLNLLETTVHGSVFCSPDDMTVVGEDEWTQENFPSRPVAALQPRRWSLSSTMRSLARGFGTHGFSPMPRQQDRLARRPVDS